MKRTIILAALAAAALATSCDTEGTGAKVSEENAINFRAVVDKNASRATTIGSVNDLTSFFVDAYVTGKTTLDFMNSAVYRNAGAWTYAPNKYYPSNGTTAVNFFAYAPIKDVNMTAMTLSGTTVSFGYTVPADQSDVNTSTDLLVADASQSSGTVAFTFDHALSAVTFSAKNNNATTSELVYTISKIEITDLGNVGTFTYPWSATSWNVAAGQGVTYTAGIPESGIAILPNPAKTVNLLSKNDVMMMLPQQLGTNTKVEITYSLKDGQGVFVYKDEVRELDFGAFTGFLPGTRYNLQFEFAASELITMTVTNVTDWTDASAPLN